MYRLDEFRPPRSLFEPPLLLDTTTIRTGALPSHRLLGKGCASRLRGYLVWNLMSPFPGLILGAPHTSLKLQLLYQLD